MIEIEGLPEGFEINSVTINAGETISQCFNTIQATIHLKKIQPRRIVLEETNEERRICYGEWYESQEGKLMRWPYGGKTDGKHRVWHELKETEETKLSLIIQRTKPREITIIETEQDNIKHDGKWCNQHFRDGLILTQQPKYWRIKEE